MNVFSAGVRSSFVLGLPVIDFYGEGDAICFYR